LFVHFGIIRSIFAQDPQVCLSSLSPPSSLSLPVLFPFFSVFFLFWFCPALHFTLSSHHITFPFFSHLCQQNDAPSSRYYGLNFHLTLLAAGWILALIAVELVAVHPAEQQSLKAALLHNMQVRLSTCRPVSPILLFFCHFAFYCSLFILVSHRFALPLSSFYFFLSHPIFFSVSLLCAVGR
jgi:hypothetical protein